MIGKRIFGILLILAIIIANADPIAAQIKNPLKKIKTSSEKKANENVDKGIDKTFDSMEEGIGKLFKKKDNNENEADAEPDDNDVNDESTAENVAPQEVSPQLWTKYDFVPGDTVIFEDLLENEQNGEFPSKWDLKTGNVEIAELDGQSVINFPSTANAEVVPLMKEKDDYLPEKFTIEFDAYFTEFCTKYTINLYDVVNQKNSTDLPYFIISPKDIWIQGKGGTDIVENRNYPYWQRIAISFNIRSLKIYFGEERITNIPNLGGNPSGLSIKTKQCHEGFASLIKNIRIAKGSMNLYERVVTEGKFITNGIRFDVGKATLRPESMGVINQIYKLMSEHTDLNFSVEGHTDSDGDEANNMKLSEERAATVKNVLVERGIDASRLSAKGLGESIPVDSNGTPEGKANNRRVEFIKI